ncbi:hypothetical protein C6Y40_03870 [Alteromonas alba]|uniref:Uncharacterized protein n=1 Tax=Alteromonas alba TaxID=2079529 RepID=A0A2S9VEP2_9ALTE|nr:hypothetical protein [Alteromonas alba]PRO74941.1 hypothetical protein C6Y40_03870 [Alteromonas alba]
MIYDLFSAKAPADSLFYIKAGSSVEDNPFNPRVIVAEGDEFWDGKLTYRNLSYEQSVAMRTFINKLRGPVGQFWFKDYAHQQSNAWGGNPVVDGNNQDGTLLGVRNLTPNILLPEGDRFQLGDFLYELTSDIAVDSSGEAELEFLPDIRLIPSDGDALIVNDPKCKCMLYGGQTPPQPSRGKAVLTDYEFTFRESIRD